MRYINKNRVPEDFSEWKRNHQRRTGRKALYEDLKNSPIKGIVKLSLLNEQFWTCCYCGNRILEGSSHIEHLKPKRFRNLQTDYRNLLVSCNGHNDSLHCGHKKNQWYNSLMISPLQHDCESYFQYFFDGTVMPTSEPEKELKARTTIEKLGLDTSILNDLRKSAIEGILYLEDLTLEDVVNFIEAYQEPDDDGKLSPFCSAVIYVLKQELIKMA